MTESTYVLTAAQFDGLAAGYGTLDALNILRDGQLAKRKALLQELMWRLDRNPAVELLLRAEAAMPETTTEVLRHPHLDAWASQVLRKPGDTGYLAQVAAAAAIRAGLTFDLDVPVTHGQVYLPGLGAAVVGDVARTEIRSADGVVLVGPVRLDGAGWHETRRVPLEPGFALTIEDQEPYRDTYQWRPAPRLDPEAAHRFSLLLREAWEIMVARHPEHADAMRVLLRVVVPLAGAPSGGSVSAASRQASGSVAVVVPSTGEELCLLLLHEFMHMKLDALRDLVDLHDPEPKERYLAPWRMDPRPAGALLQGIYAHAGVTDYWRRRRLGPSAPPVADVEYAYWRQQNWLAIETLAGSAELTVEGARLVGRLRRTLSRWQSEPVPREVAATVKAMVCAQTIRWRLRNWHPADTELRRVLGAWRRGEHPGTIAASGVLRTEAEGQSSGIPGIVGVIRQSLAGGYPTNAADRAYLDGDSSRAAHLYNDQLATTGSDDAWVGFALAAGGTGSLAPILWRRPDLVRDVVRTLVREEGRADAMEVARWLTTG